MTRFTLLLAAFAGCQLEPPAAPSFQQDVMPILAANCIRCHGYPTLGGSPASMRLDVYSDISVDGATVLTGAARLAPIIAARVASATESMPPRFPLDDFQIETLQNWANGISPGDQAPRGEPRPNNRAPHIEVTSIVHAGAITILSSIDDDDNDLVAGELRALLNGSERIVGPVRSGLVEIRWGTTGIAPGDYPLSAHLDDGAQVHAIALGTITIGGP